MGKIFSVISGKGGAGKSTVCVGVAARLARLGKKILVIDMDIGLRSLDLMLGVEEQAVYDLSDILNGNCEPIKAIVPCDRVPGLDLIPSPVAGEHTVDLQAFGVLCRGLAQHYDYVLLDAPAGLGPVVDACVRSCHSALLVVNTDAVCVRDAQAMAQFLNKRDKDARIVLNKVYPDFIQKNRQFDFDQIIDFVGLRLLGFIPQEPLLQLSLLDFIESHQKAPASVAFSNIARRITGEQVALYRV